MSEITVPAPFSVRRDGALARIDLGRPEEHNMLTRGMISDLSALVAALGQDAGVNVVALEGRGQSFCKGRDGCGENAAGTAKAFCIRCITTPSARGGGQTPVLIA